MIRRVLAVALLRTREVARGPLLPFLLLFLLAAAIAALATPGEPGPDRQRALDGFVLDVALLVSVLAAAAFGAGSLASDRESARETVLHASPLRRLELLAGTQLGHAAALLILGLGLLLGTISITGLIGGGERDRASTRVPVRAGTLLDGKGESVLGRWLMLTRAAPEGSYVLDAPEGSFDAGPGVRAADVWIQIREVVEDLNAGMPEVYPVAVRVGAGPEEVIQLRTGNPLRFALDISEVRGEADTRIFVRRLDPELAIGLAPGGLVVQGRTRPFVLNLAKAFAAWLLGCIVIAAASNAFASVVGAPVAVCGGLFLALVGRSLSLLAETAHYLEEASGALGAGGRRALEAVVAAAPDFRAFDLTHLVTSRWDIGLAALADRLGASVAAAAVLLAVAWVLLWLRRLL